MSWQPLLSFRTLPSQNKAIAYTENAGGILHQVSGEIILLQMGCLACPVRLFVLTESGIEARGFVWARSSRCSC